MKVSLHKGGAQDWSLSRHTLAALKSHLKPGLRTVETGAGHSTLVFAEAGCVHTAITPSQDEIARIKAEGAARGLDMRNVTFVVAMSQDGFPTLDDGFDVALIDGGHGFPVPQLDFYFAASKLKTGGILILDDVQLWSVRTILQFLKAEPGWTHLGTVEAKTSFFRMDRPYGYSEWRDQPYTNQRSLLHRRLGQGHRAILHIARGDFAHLAGAMRRAFRRKFIDA